MAIEVKSFKTARKTIVRPCVKDVATVTSWSMSNAKVVREDHRAVASGAVDLKNINMTLRGKREPVPEITAAKSLARTG